MSHSQKDFLQIIRIVVFCLLGACAGPSYEIVGNEGGSKPINESEYINYSRAIKRCYKTGGTRIVKINNKLRCF